VLHTPDALKRIVAEYRELFDKNPTRSLDFLFRQWQDETAQRSLQLYPESKKNNDTWVHWAIRSLMEGKTGIPGFRKRLDEWLNGLNANAFKKQRMHLACLTVDLADKAHRTRFSGLFATAFEDFRQRSELDKTRSSIARDLCPPGTIDTIFKIWIKHFAHLIPDPSSSGSDYLHPVAWVKVLHKLNPDAYAKLIGRWKKTHHLRRNLWRALSEAKLPVE